MKYILSTLAFLALVLAGALAAPDAQAFGHGRAAGCGAAASGCAGAHGSYAGWYPGKHLFGFERRQARRASRRAARHAAYASYGCAGAPAAASCSEPGGYNAAPPASYEGTPEPVVVSECPAGVNCPNQFLPHL